jgi:hypothetical protein
MPWQTSTNYVTITEITAHDLNSHLPKVVLVRPQWKMYLRSPLTVHEFYVVFREATPSLPRWLAVLMAIKTTLEFISVQW